VRAAHGDRDDPAYHSEYLAGIEDDERARLVRVNRSGLAALKGYLANGKAIAFLGAGASAPLYPLWGGVISELVEAAADRLSERAAATCLTLASENPDAVVEIVRRELGAADYREVLREVFRVRRDPSNGRTWTPVQELVTRCNFRGVVTTNYDPGIINARMAIRPEASGTGFASYTDEDALDRWRTGDVFGDVELPVLYAHGHHNQPDAIVLATTEYRRAYTGKLARVLGRLMDSEHLVWIGFSFKDERIGAIIREISESSGLRTEPGSSPRHVVLLPWYQTSRGQNEASDPDVIRDVMEIQYGCRVVLYPVYGQNHDSLHKLLEQFTDRRFPPADRTASEKTTVRSPDLTQGDVSEAAGAARQPFNEHSAVGVTGSRVRWVHGGVPIDNFTGREEELARLDRWAADSEVRLIGVTAWGGAGKTALVTEWLTRQRSTRRTAIRGMFAWSFYEEPSTEAWLYGLLTWVEKTFGYRVGTGRIPERVLALIKDIPLLLVLDGMEVTQEGPAGTMFGRLLDGALRSILIGFCQLDHRGLAVLTSRFPFADLEAFDGVAARMLEVPPLTSAEGSRLLARAGGDWLSEDDRVRLVDAVDGHALALGALAGTLRDRPPTTDMAALLADLDRAGRTDTRVAHVLRFYSDRLAPTDRYLVAIVSLFQRPVPVKTVVTLGTHRILGAPLRGWDVSQVEEVVRRRLAGVLTWHPDATLSAHPLVRDAFRPFALSADSAQLASNTALADLPAGLVISRDDGQRVVEMIELLLDADQWEAAYQLYRGRTGNGYIWMSLPAARLGQRSTSAFVASRERRSTCLFRLSPSNLGFFLNWTGTYAMIGGDISVAENYLRLAIEHFHATSDSSSESLTLLNLSTCLAFCGKVGLAVEAGSQALDLATTVDSSRYMRDAHMFVGSALDLAGETAAASEHFISGSKIEVRTTPESERIYVLACTRWGDLLLRTGHGTAARDLAERNHAISISNGWNDALARCDLLLARCDLTDGDLDSAGHRLYNATTIFRGGDYLVDLAATLPDLSEYQRRMGDLDGGEQLCVESISLAGSRQLVPSHAHALCARARIRTDRYTATGDPDHVERARDDAEHALRLSTTSSRLPWIELEAMRVQAILDNQTQRDNGWDSKADQLQEALMSEGLSAD
jgi:hypothetical protein